MNESPKAEGSCTDAKETCVGGGSSPIIMSQILPGQGFFKIQSKQQKSGADARQTEEVRRKGAKEECVNFPKRPPKDSRKEQKSENRGAGAETFRKRSDLR